MIERHYLEGLTKLFDMAVGEQRRYDHTGCPKGEDTRGRLYVLRKNEDVWLAYCHNCGEAGLLSKSAGMLNLNTYDLAARLSQALGVQDANSLPTLSETLVDDELQLPEDCSKRIIDWDDWAVNRLHEHHVSVVQASFDPYAWCFSMALNQIITPIYTPLTRRLIGYQARNAPGVSPKCITTYYPMYKGWPLIYWNQERPVWVLCEDPLSALTLHLHGEVNAMALLGTHLNDRALTMLTECMAHCVNPKVLIWMDSDTAGRAAAVKIAQRVSSLMPTCVVTAEAEPSKIKNVTGELKKWI